MENAHSSIASVAPQDVDSLGKLLVEVYQQLPGFPSPQQQPDYYAKLANVGLWAQQPHIDVLVAKHQQHLVGGVVFIDDIAAYGTGPESMQSRDACAFRLLAVSPNARGLGIGNALIEACFERARASGKAELIIHSTAAMQTAQRIYKRLGFQRDEQLDFMQQELPVFGFFLPLN